MGVFLFPARAYAATVVTPPTVEASISGETLRIEAQSGFYAVEAIFINDMRFNFRVDSVLQVDLLAFGDTEIITVYAMDFAGNVSNMVVLVNPNSIPDHEIENLPNSTPDEGIPVQGGNPFTPDGQASVLDHATEGDNKEFFTFRTPAGNIFFLIIDHERPNDNVYFLNAVTEQDLIALAEQSGTQINNDIGGIPVSPIPTEPSEQPSETPPEANEPPPAQSGGNSGTMIFLLIAVAVAGGAGYYFKIVRPKKQGVADDDYADEDEDEQDLGEEMEFETEREESDEGEDEIETEDDGL
jgi:hypothetical protein